MSGKQERKLEELSVNGPAFRSVLELARKRQAVMISLRAMIDEAGTELRDIVLRPGEIERMKRDLREDLRSKGDPGADEQADEFEVMLVEIRRRVEQGVLRFSRKKPAKDTASNEATPSTTEATEQIPEAGATKSDGDRLGGSAHSQGKSSENEAPSAASPGNAGEAPVRSAETGASNDAVGEGRGGASTPPLEPTTDEPEDEPFDSYEGPGGDHETSPPGPPAADRQNWLGGGGEPNAV